MRSYIWWESKSNSHGVEPAAARHSAVAALPTDAHDPIAVIEFTLLSDAHHRPLAVLSALLCSALPTSGAMVKATGWDPILIISQIIALQTLHYVTLSLLVPPLLVMFADPGSLEYEGGAANVGMLPLGHEARINSPAILFKA